MTRRSIEASDATTSSQSLEPAASIQSLATAILENQVSANGSVQADSGFAPVTAAINDEKFEQVLACNSAYAQRVAAFIAHDWLEVTKRAKAYLESCTNVVDDQTLSEAYDDLAVSANARHRAEEALNAALKCQDVYYARASCHVEKAWALIELDRSDEARTALETTMRLIPHNIKLLEQDLGKEVDPIGRENLESALARDRSLLGLAKKLYRDLQAE